MNEMAAPVRFGIGASVRRIEDQSLITGQGRYVSDITPEGTLVGYVLRSSMAHARFTLSGVEDARAAEGVHLVWTGEDIGDLGYIPTKGLVKQPDGSFPWIPPRPALNLTTVRHVGDPIAFIVADSANLAKSAAEMIEVDYVPLDVTVDTATAMDPDSPIVWPELGTNKAFEYFLGDQAKTDAAFATASKVVKLRVDNNRLITTILETRGAIGEYDPATGRYTLTAGHAGRPRHA